MLPAKAVFVSAGRFFSTFSVEYAAQECLFIDGRRFREFVAQFVNVAHTPDLGEALLAERVGKLALEDVRRKQPVDNAKAENTWSTKHLSVEDAFISIRSF